MRESVFIDQVLVLKRLAMTKCQLGFVCNIMGESIDRRKMSIQNVLLHLTLSHTHTHTLLLLVSAEQKCVCICVG